MGSLRQEIDSHIAGLPIVDTHEHTRPFPPETPPTLEYVLSLSYAGCNTGCGFYADKSRRAEFIETLSCNSFFVWLERGIDALFDIGGRLTPSNWDEVSEKMRAALEKKEFHDMVFREKCRFKVALLDTWWEPYGDNGRRDLFAPMFRTDHFLFSPNAETSDHGGHNAQRLHGKCADFDEYLSKIEELIGSAKSNGFVCLKSSAAYARSLRYEPRDKLSASRLFGKKTSEMSPDDLLLFGDYIYDYICALAAKHGLPFQNHTGLAKLSGSNPMNLIPMIERHPDTKFVLLHSGYPWVEEMASLTHMYGNVYADICWLPAICTSTAERALHSLIETSRDIKRITWGGDCHTLVESYGFLLAMRQTLGNVLEQKVSSGYLDMPRARRLAERIMHVNAEELYGVS